MFRNDAQTGDFLGVAVTNKQLRSHYQAAGVTQWPGGDNTAFALANLPMALDSQGRIRVFFVSTGEICVRITADFHTLLGRKPPSAAGLTELISE